MTGLEWFEAIPAIAVSVGILLFPGLAVAVLIGLRGLWAAALAPLISTTLYIGASVVMPLMGLRWAPILATLAVIALGALVVVLFRYVLRARFDEPYTDGGGGRTTIISWALTAVPVAIILAIGVGSPSSLSQTYDSIFHLNLVAYTTDTGNASPLVAGRMVSPAATTAFYPNVWDALVSLVHQLSGAEITVAANAFNVAAIMCVWPTGVLLLVRQLVGSTPVAMLVAGIFAGGLTALPINPLYYGVLYPFFLAMLFVPAALAIVLQLLRVTAEDPLAKTVPLGVLLLGVIPAITIAHPGAMFAALALSVPIACVAVFAHWRTLEMRSRLLRLSGLAVFGLIGLVMLVKLRPAYNWGPRVSMLEAAYRSITLALQGDGLPIVLALSMIVGIIVALRARTQATIAAVGVWLIGMLLFFVAYGVPYWTPRVFVLGVWYSDPPRLAAIYAVAALPIAVLGAVWLVERFKLATVRRSARAGFVIAGLVAVHATAGWFTFLPQVRTSYTASDGARLLSADEAKLMERVPEFVPEDAVIIGSPWTGTALAYALVDREVVMPHVQSKVSEEQQELLDDLRNADTNPAVCEALDETGVRYVLDFGTHEVRGGNHRYPGIEDLESSNAVKLVDSEGEAKLYEVTACGLGS